MNAPGRRISGFSPRIGTPPPVAITALRTPASDATAPHSAARNASTSSLADPVGGPCRSSAWTISSVSTSAHPIGVGDEAPDGDLPGTAEADQDDAVDARAHAVGRTRRRAPDAGEKDPQLRRSLRGVDAIPVIDDRGRARAPRGRKRGRREAGSSPRPRCRRARPRRASSARPRDRAELPAGVALTTTSHRREAASSVRNRLDAEELPPRDARRSAAAARHRDPASERAERRRPRPVPSRPPRRRARSSPRGARPTRATSRRQGPETPRRSVLKAIHAPPRSARVLAAPIDLRGLVEPVGGGEDGSLNGVVTDSPRMLSSRQTSRSPASDGVFR